MILINNNTCKELDRKYLLGIALIICSALLTSTGQALWKIANGANLLFIILGLLLYFFGALLMIFAFRFGRLSVLQPLLSLGYIFSIFIGWMFLNESISLQKCIGIFLIFIGAIFIGAKK